MYSTASDLAVVGQSILQSTFLSPTITRRWLKPVTHTSSLTNSVGAPWEIHRGTANNHVIDIYAKSGLIGTYGSMLALIPDYDVGFSVLAASSNAISESATRILSDLITDVLLPALENTARAQASTNYAGTYISEGAMLNSSLVLTTIAQNPGLEITKWIQDGKDILLALAEFEGIGGFEDLTMHLYPTNVQRRSGNETHITFRAVVEDRKAFIDRGAFSNNCATWYGLGDFDYGSVWLDEFIFSVGEDGYVLSIEPSILGSVLKRT